LRFFLKGPLKFVTQKIKFCTGGVVCQNFRIQKFYSMQSGNKVLAAPCHGTIFFGQCLFSFSATAQNGWLPILDLCGTSHFDNKMPQDRCCKRECNNLCLQICFTHRNICINCFILKIMSKICA